MKATVSTAFYIRWAKYGNLVGLCPVLNADRIFPTVIIVIIFFFVKILVILIVTKSIAIHRMNPPHRQRMNHGPSLGILSLLLCSGHAHQLSHGGKCYRSHHRREIVISQGICGGWAQVAVISR